MVSSFRAYSILRNVPYYGTSLICVPDVVNPSTEKSGLGRNAHGRQNSCAGVIIADSSHLKAGVSAGTIAAVSAALSS